MTAKDKRVAVLEEVIGHLKFIKTKTWENFFQYKMNKVRDNEVRYLFHTAAFNSIMIFVDWLNNRNLQLSFVVAVTLWRPDIVSIGLVSAVLAIVKNFFDIQYMLPNVFNMLSDLSVSMARLEAFLDADCEICEEITDGGDDNAVEIKDVAFACLKI